MAPVVAAVESDGARPIVRFNAPALNNSAIPPKGVARKERTPALRRVIIVDEMNPRWHFSTD